MPTPEKHAMLSASSAERWLNCPPSVRATENIPDITTEYAEEGRIAHEVAELAVQSYITVMNKKTYNTRLNKIKKKPLYNDEMLNHAQTYLDYIKEISLLYAAQPFIATEQTVDFSEYVQDGFGTSDCIIIGANTLTIVDYKYGQGVPVSAENNPQMKLYAAGALNKYKLFYDIKQINMSIVQPRLNSISTSTISKAELEKWCLEVVKPAALLAYTGMGQYKSGEHCRFCKIKATCRKRADENLELVKYDFADPITLSSVEIGAVLKTADQLKKWVSDLQDYSLKAILNGEEIPGWKAVAGRAVRQITDTDAAYSSLAEKCGIEKDLLYKRIPVSMTEAESIAGKANFAEALKEFIIKPQGKPTLAVESDKRETYQITSAKEDFESKTEELL